MSTNEGAAAAVSLTLPGEPVTRAITWAKIEAELVRRGFTFEPLQGPTHCLAWTLPRKAPRETVYTRNDHNTWPAKEAERMERACEVLAQIDGIPPGIMLARIADHGAPSFDPSPLVSLLRDLRDVGSGKIAHVYMGWCPNVVEGYATRHPECDACKVLLRADEALDGRILDGTEALRADLAASLTELRTMLATPNKVLIEARKGWASTLRERDEARAQLAAARAEIDTLRLLVVAGRVEMRERAAEACESNADRNFDDNGDGAEACMSCAAVVRALPTVPPAKA